MMDEKQALQCNPPYFFGSGTVIGILMWLSPLFPEADVKRDVKKGKGSLVAPLALSVIDPGRLYMKSLLMSVVRQKRWNFQPQSNSCN